MAPSFPTPFGHSAVLDGACGKANGSISGNSQDAPIKEWRAMLSITLKARKRSLYGTGRNISGAVSVASGGATSSNRLFVTADQMEVDIEVIVEGVEKRGVGFFSSARQPRPLLTRFPWAEIF